MSIFIKFLYQVLTESDLVKNQLHAQPYLKLTEYDFLCLKPKNLNT